jgi:glycerol transport system ATP-binding protein
VTQFGPTAQVYRQPADATTARVFSDPPMNFIRLEKRGDEMRHAKGAFAAGTMGQALPDGTYLAGFRASHLTLEDRAGTIRFDTTLNVTEITGSETFVHLDHDDDRWVGLIHGIRNLKPGQALPVWLDPACVYLFSDDGALVAGAAYAEAA